MSDERKTPNEKDLLFGNAVVQSVYKRLCDDFTDQQALSIVTANLLMLKYRNHILGSEEAYEQEDDVPGGDDA